MASAGARTRPPDKSAGPGARARARGGLRDLAACTRETRIPAPAAERDYLGGSRGCRSRSSRSCFMAVRSRCGPRRERRLRSEPCGQRLRAGDGLGHGGARRAGHVRSLAVDGPGAPAARVLRPRAPGPGRPAVRGTRGPALRSGRNARGRPAGVRGRLRAKRLQALGDPGGETRPRRGRRGDRGRDQGTPGRAARGGPAGGDGSGATGHLSRRLGDDRGDGKDADRGALLDGVEHCAVRAIAVWRLDEQLFVRESTGSYGV